MTEISIIVPVYNKEQYLTRCIDSLINQSFTEIEIILVDDGSTDMSLKICKNHERSDSRIKVITKENGGASSARNMGMRAAHGKYLMFVDADDYIEKKTCEILWSRVNLDSDIDIVLGERVYHSFSGDMYSMFHLSDNKGKILSGQEYMLAEMRKQSMYFVVVSALYKKQFIFDNHLFFKEGIYNEDEDWVPRAFILASRVVDTGIVIYHHCETVDSVMKSNKEKHDRDCVGLCYDLFLFQKKFANKELQIALENYLFYLYVESIISSKLYKEKGFVDKILILKMAHGWKNYIKALCIFINKTIFFELINMWRSFKKIWR